jgi:hypothetical protein
MPSSVISTYSYDEAKHILRVVFLSGMVYDYLDVPNKVYEQMKNSISKGGFLNRVIKNHYSFKKIDT